MLIPIRCVSCNNPLAGKWLKYQELVAKKKVEDGLDRTAPIPYLTTMTTKTAEGRAMDELKLTRECCRRHVLTHVDLL
jgi:DNA-directed RNA polymerase I, II, and III subunit RPABC5